MYVYVCVGVKLHDYVCVCVCGAKVSPPCAALCACLYMCSNCDLFISTPQQLQLQQQQHEQSNRNYRFENKQHAAIIWININPSDTHTHTYIQRIYYPTHSIRMRVECNLIFSEHLCATTTTTTTSRFYNLNIYITICIDCT